jgi:hypothetical protein
MKYVSLTEIVAVNGHKKIKGEIIMSMLDDSSKNFIAALASKAPVPGGGGAAALGGAIGMALS